MACSIFSNSLGEMECVAATILNAAELYTRYWRALSIRSDGFLTVILKFSSEIQNGAVM